MTSPHPTRSTLDGVPLALALALAAAGCGDDDAPPGGDAGGDSGASRDSGSVVDAATDGGEPRDAAVDHDPSAREGADVLLGLHLGVALADSLFDFDSTIDPAATAAGNATAIGANTRANLGGCGTVTVTGTTVAVDLGAPPGCALATGITASGTVGVSVSKSAATTVVAVDLSAATVRGRALAGTLTFTTTDGSTFMAAAAGGAATGLLTVSGAAGAFTVAGTLTAGGGTTPTGVTFLDVIWRRGDCYPSGGSIRVAQGFLVQTLAFTPATATTGTCDRTIAARTTSFALPAYGSCPAGAAPDAGTAGTDAGAADAGPPDADAGTDSGIDAGG